ncbi:MAG: vitamin K epoxide reductase family protein [Actinomycetota bacterium]
MRRPAWVAPAGFAVAIAGTTVSTYLTIAHFTSPKLLACVSTGVVNCERVTTSAQSEVLSVPVALIGLAWFLAMSGLYSPWAWRSAAPWIRIARLAAAAIAMAFVLWLVYAELFVIRAICLWCTAVHVLAFVLFVIVVLYGSEAADDER